MMAYTYDRNRLYEISLEGESVVKSINIPSPDDFMFQLTPHTWCSTPTPVDIKNGKVVTTGFLFYEGDLEETMPYYSTVIVDQETDSVSFVVRYPDLYARSDWGGSFYYRLPYHCVDESGNVVVSFPASDSLVVYSLSDGQTFTVDAHARQSFEIKPIGKNGVREHTSSELLDWYLGTPSYENVLYDEYNKVYFRVAKLPQVLPYDSKRGTQKPLLLVVFDDTFHYLGEGLVPDSESLITTNMFVTKEGLAIQKRSDNEDELIFNVYSVAHD